MALCQRCVNGNLIYYQYIVAMRLQVTGNLHKKGRKRPGE